MAERFIHGAALGDHGIVGAVDARVGGLLTGDRLGILGAEAGEEQLVLHHVDVPAAHGALPTLLRARAGAGVVGAVRGATGLIGVVVQAAPDREGIHVAVLVAEGRREVRHRHLVHRGPVLVRDVKAGAPGAVEGAGFPDAIAGVVEVGAVVLEHAGCAEGETHVGEAYVVGEVELRGVITHGSEVPDLLLDGEESVGVGVGLRHDTAIHHAVLHGEDVDPTVVEVVHPHEGVGVGTGADVVRSSSRHAGEPGEDGGGEHRGDKQHRGEQANYASVQGGPSLHGIMSLRQVRMRARARA